MFGSGSDGYEVTDEFLFIGRTLEEYRSMFAIDVAELARGSVLDCAGGPASFTAEASRGAPAPGRRGKPQAIRTNRLITTGPPARVRV